MESSDIHFFGTHRITEDSLEAILDLEDEILDKKGKKERLASRWGGETV